MVGLVVCIWGVVCVFLLQDAINTNDVLGLCVFFLWVYGLPVFYPIIVEYVKQSVKPSKDINKIQKHISNTLKYKNDLETGSVKVSKNLENIDSCTVLDENEKNKRIYVLQHKIEQKTISKSETVESKNDENDKKREALEVIIQNRKIKYLYHFTPIDNLDSILMNGLLSRKMLYNQRKNYMYTDPNRFDRKYDRISCSVMWPNYYMMKQKKEQGFKFVLIRISTDVLYDLDCLFFSDNAAKNTYVGCDNLNTERDFEEFFAKQVNGYIRQPGCLDCYPTSVQAEVMVRDCIPKKYFCGIIVENDEIYSRILPTCAMRAIDLTCEPKYFGARDVTKVLI